MKSGIYAIRNAVTGKRYIGSAVRFSRRFSQHKHELGRGTHHSIKLQRAWLKYGEAAFVFEVVESVEDLNALVAREQCWIDFFGSHGPKGYNVLTIAGSSMGYQHDEDAKAKMRGRQFSEEHRAKISATSAGRRYSDETKAKISLLQKGKPKSEETKAKMRAAAAGRKCKPRTPEHIANHAASMRASLAKKFGKQAEA